MPRAVMTTKGQVTIPIEIREELGLKTGDCIEFFKNADTGRFELAPRTRSVRELRGMFKYDGPPVSIEDMDRAIGDYLAEKVERINREWRERH